MCGQDLLASARLQISIPANTRFLYSALIIGAVQVFLVAWVLSEAKTIVAGYLTGRTRVFGATASSLTAVFCFIATGLLYSHSSAVRFIVSEVALPALQYLFAFLGKTIPGTVVGFIFVGLVFLLQYRRRGQKARRLMKQRLLDGLRDTAVIAGVLFLPLYTWTIVGVRNQMDHTAQNVGKPDMPKVPPPPAEFFEYLKQREIAEVIRRTMDRRTVASPKPAFAVEPLTTLVSSTSRSSGFWLVRRGIGECLRIPARIATLVQVTNTSSAPDKVDALRLEGSVDENWKELTRLDTLGGEIRVLAFKNLREGVVLEEPKDLIVELNGRVIPPLGTVEGLVLAQYSLRFGTVRIALHSMRNGWAFSGNILDQPKLGIGGMNIPLKHVNLIDISGCKLYLPY